MSKKDAKEAINEEEMSENSEAADNNAQEALQTTHDELVKELNEAQAKIEEQMDSVLRAKAEVDNIRRRAQTDVANAHKFGNEKIVTELLPVIDSLERCLEFDAAGEEMLQKVHEGVDLTRQMFLSALEKAGVEQVNPLHDDFNSELHEAVQTEENSEVKSGSVVRVLQRGYTINQRLIRPALVVVAK